MTPRTENILGALFIIALVSGLLALAGYVVPNYIVYFKYTINQTPECNQQ